MHRSCTQGVAADVSFVLNRFPSYGKVGLHSDTMGDEEEPPSPLSAHHDLATKEAAQLVEQQREFSVRDLASKFERGQAAAQVVVAKLCEDVWIREATSLGQQALLQRLREVIEALQGRVAGRNKDDAEEALTAVEALTGQMGQSEAELAQEKSEVRKLAALFKQVCYISNYSKPDTVSVNHARRKPKLYFLCLLFRHYLYVIVQREAIDIVV